MEQGWAPWDQRTPWGSHVTLRSTKLTSAPAPACCALVSVGAHVTPVQTQPLNGFSKKCDCNLQVLLEGVQPWEVPEGNMPSSSASSLPSCHRWSLRPTWGTKKQTPSRQVLAGPLLPGLTWEDQFTFWHVPS